MYTLLRRDKMMKRYNSYACPKCEQDLEQEEAVRGEDSEPVWICTNLECENYDEIVFDEGDIMDFEESNATERLIDERRGVL
jgi:hypothetical protein